MSARRSPRALRVDGLVNARDLGGLRRADGTTTPTGVFYRSESVDWVTATGWDQLYAAGIRTVVDLRQPEERANDTTPRPDWLTTTHVDLDGLDHRDFWTYYQESGLIGTAVYYQPHLAAMPDRSVAALSAIVTAPSGGVLFHCRGGRDRTGMIAMLLLAAVDTTTESIVDDYLETVRLGDIRAAGTNLDNDEADRDALCEMYGTTTENAFRAALTRLDLARILDAGEMTAHDRAALHTWRGALTHT